MINYIAGLKNSEFEHDPTYFSKISECYQTIVRQLMECLADALPEGAQPQDLDKFRQIYSESAFICRYRDCARYSDGFKLSAARDEHEELHMKPLRCTDPSCDFFARGFKSKTGLLKHNRKYHPCPDEVEVPAFEVRNEVELQPVELQPIALPPPEPASPVRRVETPPKSPTPEEVDRRHPPPKRSRVSRAQRGMRVHECNNCLRVHFD